MEELGKENILKKDDNALKAGMSNLYKHIHNLQKQYGLNVIVALNKYNTDTDEEIQFVKSELSKQNIEMNIVEGWAKGGEGAIDIAKNIIKLSNNKTNLKLIYDNKDSIKEKIEKVATKIYGATEVIYSEEALKDIKQIERLEKSDFPICIAKTQYSFSDDDKNVECKEPFKITIRDVAIKNGAEFIVAYSGKILTMPGLPKIPSAENIDIDENEEITGIF